MKFEVNWLLTFSAWHHRHDQSFLQSILPFFVLICSSPVSSDLSISYLHSLRFLFLLSLFSHFPRSPFGQALTSGNPFPAFWLSFENIFPLTAYTSFPSVFPKPWWNYTWPLQVKLARCTFHFPSLDHSILILWSHVSNYLLELKLRCRNPAIFITCENPFDSSFVVESYNEALTFRSGRCFPGSGQYRFYSYSTCRSLGCSKSLS